MRQSFRFIHSSDFHLEHPLGGLAEVPDSWRASFVDAPYRAAERVFDAAIKERVDFVVLAGDLVDPLASGPRGFVFLWQQFQRLADKGIRVYWAFGICDPFERFGELGSLADHVVRFPAHRIERVVHHRGGQPLAQIVGLSSPQRKTIHADEFHTLPGDVFTLAVAYGSSDAAQLAGHGVSYWALGGEHNRRALAILTTTAHFCGSPQGRGPQEAGPHGCTLVQVDENYLVRTNFIATDAVRYHSERVTVDETTTVAQLHLMLGQRLGELLADPFGPELLVDWTIAGSRALNAELARGKLAADVMAHLRAEHAERRPAAWTVSVSAETPPGVRDERYEEETILGEFLRSVRHYVEQPDDTLNLEPYLSERHLAGSLGAAALLDEPATRERVLTEVARLGVELLSPEERRA